MLLQAMRWAAEAHENQTRSDGITPYLVHPIKVMDLVREWGVEDETVLAAALLHDVKEDNWKYWSDEVDRYVGEPVSSWINELTHEYGTDKEEYLKRWERGFAGPETFVIKVADRICNTRDFLKVNKPYARVYWNKAEPVWGLLYDTGTDCMKMQVATAFTFSVSSRLLHEVETMHQHVWKR